MDALTFLTQPPANTEPIYVIYGEEDFLKRQTLRQLKNRILGFDEFAETELSTFTGDAVEFRTVRKEVSTIPFLGEKRLIVVQQADQFVSDYRKELEKYAKDPAKSGILVLEVKSFPSNTNLAKNLADSAKVECKSPPADRLLSWCAEHARSEYGKNLERAAGLLLVELIGGSMGLIDQELAKLSVYVGNKKSITAADVDRLVAKSRTAEVFRIFEEIGNGRVAAAMAILARLFEQNQEPLQILGAFSWQLRRLAQIARLVNQGIALADAFAQTGVPPFARKSTEILLKHLGLRRLGLLYDWLIEADFGIKGESPLPPRLILEKLLVNLARPRSPNS